MRFTRRPLAALIVLPVLAVAACGSSGSSKTSGSAGSGAGTSVAPSTSPAASSSASSSASASASSTAGQSGAQSTQLPVVKDLGVKVTGSGTPTLTIPSTAAPTHLTEEVIKQGTGTTVAKGDTLVANYVGETWAKKSGKSNVFDSSYSRGAPAAFVIGEGQVISGWDKVLVGKKVGTRVLMEIPPADGYGSGGQSSAHISGTDVLVFVVDIVNTYKVGSSAPGTVAEFDSTGLPKFTNVPGKEPSITSVAGVKAPTSPKSTLVVTGTGAKIDSTKELVLQLVQTDIATGKATQSSWKQAVQVVAGANVVGIATALNGQKVGSRAVVLVPAVAATASTSATPASILIIDVIGQV